MRRIDSLMLFDNRIILHYPKEPVTLLSRIGRKYHIAYEKQQIYLVKQINNKVEKQVGGTFVIDLLDQGQIFNTTIHLKKINYCTGREGKRRGNETNSELLDQVLENRYDQKMRVHLGSNFQKKKEDQVLFGVRDKEKSWNQRRQVSQKTNIDNQQVRLIDFHDEV
ncbi:UNKNOWN [Stylonychia lemnae]|uniref:Uncharacterized protein n=1 Tax=Stylonychia lemnae TaxID=5949 RepID=A0A078BBN4_STYLE|nr:UNKNOWN [Stylonychia lemnae]|eukprot:CDW90983.1 UNKNOWN [Stylonychia lemnae]